VAGVALVQPEVSVPRRYDRFIGRSLQEMP